MYIYIYYVRTRNRQREVFLNVLYTHICEMKGRKIVFVVDKCHVLATFEKVEVDGQVFLLPIV